MSTGSSNIDPMEFNEQIRSPEIPPTSDDEPILVNPQAAVTTDRQSAGQRRRRRRRQYLMPSYVHFRIYINQSPRDQLPSRQHLQRIVYALSRSLRATNGGPVDRTPRVTYRSMGPILSIDVHKVP
ncbi:hypothetical protein KR215_004773 [Drosophila sulfurigaster]|nr:hypothetical protein KR215_004773 [Drosophila sulfurigaster]